MLWKPKRNRLNRGKRRHYVPVSFMDRLARWGLPISGVLALVACAGIVWHLAHSNQGFLITQVVVEGKFEQLHPDQVLAMLEIPSDENLLFVDLDRLSERVYRHPWVEQVRIERNFPQTLVVTVLESKPVAILATPQYYYVNSQGKIFKQLEAGDNMDFPLVVLASDAGKSGVSVELQKTAHEMIDFLNKYEQTRFAKEFGVSEVAVRKRDVTLFTRSGHLQLEFMGEGASNPFDNQLLKLDRYYPQIVIQGDRPQVLDLRLKGKIVASAMKAN